MPLIVKSSFTLKTWDYHSLREAIPEEEGETWPQAAELQIQVIRKKDSEGQVSH